MDLSTTAAEQPRYIKLNERDNVAIVVNDFGLPAGARFACGLTLRADPALWRGDRPCRLADPGRRMGRRSAHPHAGRAVTGYARDRDRGASTIAAA